MKKITQSELNNKLFAACDSLRKTMDSSEYKDYVLVMLFLKYVSDFHQERKEQLLKRYNNDLEMVKRQLKNERFILDDGKDFNYLFERRNENNIGEEINKVLESIENNNSQKLQGVFRNIDFNSEAKFGRPIERNAILKNLINDFSKVDLRPSNLPDADIIGNSYEYLISQFASDAGKKGGEFFTPSQVSELLSRLVEPTENERIYDPTCGSGSLLLKALNQIPNKKAQLYGQESNGQTFALCRMNMFLHGADDARIEWGDTIANPLHLDTNGRLMKFDVIVANPPFSLDKWASGLAGEGKMEASLDPHNRFSWGVPPKSRGDYAFVLHMIHSLNNKGRMAVVLPHGVLFRGAAELRIRKQIIHTNLLHAVIGIPANLFFGTSIPACILVFKHRETTNRDILFIDASQEGMFEKVKNQNILRDEDIERIVKTYKDYKTTDKYSYVATIDEIKENDYNLNISRYVDTFEEEEPIDIHEVLSEIKKLQKERDELSKEIEKYMKELGIL